MSEIFVCTPENPWGPGKPTPVRHSDTREIGDQEDGWPSGDIVRMECKICGHTWKEELPQ